MVHSSTLPPSTWSKQATDRLRCRTRKESLALEPRKGRLQILESEYMLEFIEYPKCTTCKKAKKELDQLGLEYKDVHIVEETPSETVILNWLETSGFELKQFFNTSGIKYRELGLKDKVGTLSNKEAAKLLASDGMLLKRPILVKNGQIQQIGYHREYEGLALK